MKVLEGEKMARSSRESEMKCLCVCVRDGEPRASVFFASRFLSKQIHSEDKPAEFETRVFYSYCLLLMISEKTKKSIFKKSLFNLTFKPK